MHRKFIQVIIALITFTIGSILTIKTDLPIAWVSFLVILFTIPFIILAIVMYSGIRQKSNLRPTLGKGVLAIVLWLALPSFVASQFNAVYVLKDSHLQPVSVETLLSKLTILILNIAYAFVGLGLCYWVNRFDKNN